jgi:hypothetical protein
VTIAIACCAVLFLGLMIRRLVLSRAVDGGLQVRAGRAIRMAPAAYFCSGVVLIMAAQLDQDYDVVSLLTVSVGVAMVIVGSYLLVRK